MHLYQPLNCARDTGKIKQIEFTCGIKINDDIEVAVRSVLHASDRAENGEMTNALFLKFGARFLQCTEHMGEATSVLGALRQGGLERLKACAQRLAPALLEVDQGGTRNTGAAGELCLSEPATGPGRTAVGGGEVVAVGLHGDKMYNICLFVKYYTFVERLGFPGAAPAPKFA